MYGRGAQKSANGSACTGKILLLRAEVASVLSSLRPSSMLSKRPNIILAAPCKVMVWLTVRKFAMYSRSSIQVRQYDDRRNYWRCYRLYLRKSNTKREDFQLF